MVTLSHGESHSTELLFEAEAAKKKTEGFHNIVLEYLRVKSRNSRGIVEEITEIEHTPTTTKKKLNRVGKFKEKLHHFSHIAPETPNLFK